jgi:hypothetical protein
VEIGDRRIGLDLFPKNPDHQPAKKQPFNQEIHLKIPLLSRDLNLKNSKPGCRVSALHFFVKQTPPMAF